MLSRIEEIEGTDKLNSLSKIKFRNWNITKLSPDNFLCTYDKDGDERTHTVKSIHIITKPDEYGRVFIRTENLPLRGGNVCTEVASFSSDTSNISAFVIDSLIYLSRFVDKNILELKNHFSNRFSDKFFDMLTAVTNHDIGKVRLILDEAKTEGESFLRYAILSHGSIMGKKSWEQISPFLYAAWSGDVRLVKLMLEYIPDYYQHEAATVLAKLIEVGTDQGPLMQPYLSLVEKCKQLAALLKWNSSITPDECYDAIKQVAIAQAELPEFGIYLLCDHDFYKPDYRYLDDSKRCRKINGAENWGGGLGGVESIWVAALGFSSIIYIQKNGKNLLPSVGSLESTDKLPMWDGEAALFMAIALRKYYKNVKLELSNLILSCIKKYNPNGIRPLDNLAGFSGDIPGRGIRLFYPKHAFEGIQIHDQDKCTSYSPAI